MSWIKNRSLRVVLAVQLIATLAVASVGLVLYGVEIAISALLGGMSGVLPSCCYALLVSRYEGYTPGGAIRVALQAEAVKIYLTIIMLWFSFVFYEKNNAIVLIGTLIVIVLLNSIVLLVSEVIKNN